MHLDKACLNMLGIGQAASCVTSLCSLAWSLTSYHRLLRLFLHLRDNKAVMSYGGMVLQFVWRLFTIASRVLALSLFASALGYWVFVVVACHWLSMFTWLLLQKTDFCSAEAHCNKCQEIFFKVVLAAVYIFCYVNLTDGHSRLHYSIYYVVVYLENFFMCMVWYVFAHTENKWYTHPSLLLIFVGFLVGIFFQVVYYLWCHPNNGSDNDHPHIKLCLTIDELLNRDPPEAKSEPVQPVTAASQLL